MEEDSYDGGASVPTTAPPAIVKTSTTRRRCRQVAVTTQEHRRRRVASKTDASVPHLYASQSANAEKATVISGQGGRVFDPPACSQHNRPSGFAASRCDAAGDPLSRSFFIQ